MCVCVYVSTYYIIKHPRPHKVGHACHLVHVYSSLLLQLAGQRGESTQQPRCSASQPTHTTKIKHSKPWWSMDNVPTQRENCQTTERPCLRCTHGSCTTVGRSVRLLCSLTAFTRSKLLLMGLSGFGQQGALYWRTSSTKLFCVVREKRWKGEFRGPVLRKQRQLKL